LGLFDLFSKKTPSPDTGSLVIGWLRTQTSKHLGLPVLSKEFESACASAAERVESVLLPALEKETQQAVYETLLASCGKRANEAFGEYLVLLWVRYGKIQHAIAAGQVKPEEATIPILSQALNNQIKRLIATEARK
jgi:hypothetical protein